MTFATPWGDPGGNFIMDQVTKRSVFRHHGCQLRTSEGDFRAFQHFRLCMARKSPHRDLPKARRIGLLCRKLCVAPDFIAEESKRNLQANTRPRIQEPQTQSVFLTLWLGADARMLFAQLDFGRKVSLEGIIFDAPEMG
jgi:hypothetical protein